MSSTLKEIHEEIIKRKLHLRALLTGEILGPLTGKPGVDEPWLVNFSEEEIEEFPFIEKTVFRNLYDNIKDNLDDIAIEYEGLEITNRETIENIINLACALKKMGVEKGDKVSICLPNTPESRYFLYACSIIGAIADYIDPISSVEGLEDYLNISNPKHLIAMDMVFDKFKGLIEKKNIVNVVITSPIESLIPSSEKSIEEQYAQFMTKESDYVNSTQANFTTYKKFIQEGKGAYTLEEIELEYEPNRPVAVVHSGGSTGTPKGTLMSNDNLNNFATQIMRSNMGYKRGKKILSLMPEFVGYGLSLGMHVPAVAGMREVMIARYVPEEIDDLLMEHKPNVVTASPAHLELFSESKKIEAGVDLSGLEAFIVGGAAIHPKVEKKANELLVRNGSRHLFREGYGFTEHCCAVAMCGIPLVFTDVTIYNNEKGEDCAYDEEGEVCVTGPAMMLEYLNNPEENAVAFRRHADGKVWFHSGDLGKISKDGKFKCTGRIKDLIILYNGQKVYPVDVEKILSNHPYVKNIALVDAQDIYHLNGQVPIAFCIFNNDTVLDETITSLDAYAKEKLVSYAVPVKYFSVDEFPKTKTGKVAKKILRKEVMVDEKGKNYILVPKNK